ncbi:gamma-glutamyltransferase [Rhodopila sp.]|uniref:gamma-glutamyltransferase n=1 Tax=Rhodopila sp. TaxID=2480087 RepID=UPI003D13BCF6
MIRPLVQAAALALCLLAVAANAASPPPTESTTGLVVSAQRLAAEAGVDILRQGGNAIDAAVAVGYAEAVVNPCCGNIGGGGFLTAHLPDGRSEGHPDGRPNSHLDERPDGRPDSRLDERPNARPDGHPNGRDVFLDFRETAPAAAARNMYLDADGNPIPGASLRGWKAAGVPGSVLGLDTALVKYGTMSRAAVMAPAIRLARQGFTLTAADADILARGASLLRRNRAAAGSFLRPDGSALQAGDRLRQPDLAATLQAIADHGPDAFYKGDIPRQVEAASRAGGGILTAADFAAYRVTEAAPLTCPYRGYVVETAPPPGGGVTVCQILNILQFYDLDEIGFHSAEAVHVMAEAFRLAFFDRNTYLGDPDFVHAPLHRLLSTDYAARLRGTIGDRATPSASLGPAVAPPGEAQETTHFSVLDKSGGAVAVTYTLNGGFGAGVIAGNTGFLLNDEMDDFTLKPGVANQFGLVQGEANAIAAGKRPLSSMAPTIVLRDGRVQMVLGSPGGPRIITAVVQTILNMIDYGMNAQEAVDAPRLHQQWLPDLLYAERFALSPDTEAMLRQMGYQIRRQQPSGAVELIASGALGLAQPPHAGSDASAPKPSMDVKPTGVRSMASAADAVATHAAPPSVYFGANDSRRPAGVALAP